MISAKVICDSVSEAGGRITTMELNYPRIIHAEFMTHRMFSRNAASSRAIPFDKMLQQLDGVPSRFGAAKAGMQDDGSEHNGIIYLPVYEEFEECTDSGLMTVETAWLTAIAAWLHAKDSAVEFSKAFKEAGFHKQVYNRLTEPFQMIKVVVTATEWGNFFWLRDDVMADPTLQELARKMKVAYGESTPNLLKTGDYHLPYVETSYEKDGTPIYYIEETLVDCRVLKLEDAIKVSAARCAAVSYRSIDYNLEKCRQIYKRLVTDERVHASALEHQCSPIPLNATLETEGVTSLHKTLGLMSGNMSGWLQHRQFIKGNTKYGIS